MLELAAVNKADIVYDLGSGDGGFVIRAAKKTWRQSDCYRDEPTTARQSEERHQRRWRTPLVEFRGEDALKADISRATVVVLYMLPWFNEAMKPSFQKYLKTGTRIVTPTSASKAGSWTKRQNYRVSNKNLVDTSTDM